MTNNRKDDEAALVPRVAETLRLIRELRNPNRAELASKLGCSPSTAAAYTAELRARGLIVPSSAGRFARWRLVEEPVKAKAGPAPRLLEQTSSVWHYAQRCATYNLKG
jgi:DNA-binding transcriptional MocR family regulator